VRALSRAPHARDHQTNAARWAFAEQKDAKKYLKQDGGQPATFKEALTAASEEVAQETQAVKTRRKE